MTDLKHTEGPWAVNGFDILSVIAIKDGSDRKGRSFKDGRHQLAISTSRTDNGISFDEAEANTRLSSCAPEMLAMLIKIRDHEFGFSKGQVDENEVNQLIKKARGEA